MDNRRSLPGGSAPGLASPQARAAARDSALEAPHARRADLAIHRERRLKVATIMLVASLALGAVQFVEFTSLSFPPASQRLELHGRVLDDTSVPVGDALVEIPALGVSNRTDADGNFTIPGVPVGRTNLVVTKDGYKTSNFTIFVVPGAVGSGVANSPGPLQVPPGQGTYAEDLTTTRDGFVNACLVSLIIGLLLNVMGLVSLLGRRRYRHALLGGVGAMIWALLYLGPLLGLVAIFLIFGAREQFQDSRPLFGATQVVPLNPEEGEAATEGPTEGPSHSEAAPAEPPGEPTEGGGKST